MEAWLTTFRCSQNPAHLLYVEEAVAGRIEIAAGDEIGCLWGDDGAMERLPSEFEVAVTGKLRPVPVPMDPIPPAA